MSLRRHIPIIITRIPRIIVPLRRKPTCHPNSRSTTSTNTRTIQITRRRTPTPITPITTPRTTRFLSLPRPRHRPPEPLPRCWFVHLVQSISATSTFRLQCWLPTDWRLGSSRIQAVGTSQNGIQLATRSHKIRFQSLKMRKQRRSRLECASTHQPGRQAGGRRLNSHLHPPSLTWLALHLPLLLTEWLHHAIMRAKGDKTLWCMHFSL